MENFTKRLQALNEAQRAAVDTIEGPLMVVAGPGTGKTELLSVRVANILQKTDALPQNILCLTFTESGARAMRDRLSTLIGNDANKVAIYTFHAFGSETISSYGEYFYEGARFQAADDLSSYDVLAPILKGLPSRSRLNSQLNGTYTYLKDIKSSIAHLKRGGLTPDEFERVLEANASFLEWSTSHIDQVFSQKISKKINGDIESLITTLKQYDEPELGVFNYQPLSEIITESLSQALEEATAIDKTSPITAWKSSHIKKDSTNRAVLKPALELPKLKELAHVYRQYLKGMEEQELYDFDDMIMRVVQAMELHDELRFQLQETYQYILVDEFQDTNDAQMRLLWNLTNSPTSEGKPNLMVVGDDDQAIYRFQGATMSNVLEFTERYEQPTIVTLTENYRSNADILDMSRSIITQAQERLEHVIPQLNKTLHANRSSSDASITHQQYESSAHMRDALAKALLEEYQSSPDNARAVIARNHRQLRELLAHLQHVGLPIRYEHEENIFDSEPVQQLLLVSAIVTLLARQQIEEAEALLPELLSHPAWGISTETLWTVSLTAYKSQMSWIEVMLGRDDRLHSIAMWLLSAVALSQYEPLEAMIDYLFGSDDHYAPDSEHDESEPFNELPDESFASPYKHYFFPKELLDTKPAQYLTYLGDIRTLRETVRSYRPGEQLRLRDLIDCVDMHQELELPIRSTSEIAQDISAVTLLTAHKSKGLEFDSVYIIDANEEIWGARAKSSHSKLSFPNNLPLAPAGENNDERLRLLYVALTRAKSNLAILSSKENDANKTQSPIGAIGESRVELKEIALPSSLPEQIDILKRDWRQPHFDSDLATKEQLLSPLLERYRLSATHLNNFIDITKGGPQQFLLSNLLHFPQAMHSSAAYGSAVHKTLQLAHQHLCATKQLKPIEDVLGDFEKQLIQYRLSVEDFENLLERGQMSLTEFLNQRYDSFTPTQQVEHAFSQESIVVDGARLTGAIDLIDIDRTNKTIKVTDYKTGKAFATWKATTDFDKIKLHKYQQQLMFYKLLIENSRHYQGYTVTSAALSFVEPNERGEILTLEYEFNDEAMLEFRSLIQAVWQKIMALDFDFDITNYGAKFSDVTSFESSLRVAKLLS